MKGIVLFLVTCMGSIALAAGEMDIDVTLSPAGHFTAKSHELTGMAYKTAGGGVAAENVIINLKNLKTDISVRDQHTKEHLMVDKFPQAKLIKATGKDGKGIAEIEVKGKKLKVSGTYKVEDNHMLASFPMKLSDIDITGVRYMGVGVKDEVTVRLDLPLAATRAAASVANPGQ